VSPIQVSDATEEAIGSKISSQAAGQMAVRTSTCADPTGSIIIGKDGKQRKMEPVAAVEVLR